MARRYWTCSKPSRSITTSIAKIFAFPVQWVCRPGSTTHHDFRGYMGRIDSGTVKAGDAIAVLPSGRSSRVKQILSYDGPLSRAYAPQSVTLLLEDDLDVSRGDMIVNSFDAVRVANEFNADICWLSEQPLDTRAQIFDQTRHQDN